MSVSLRFRAMLAGLAASFLAGCATPPPPGPKLADVLAKGARKATRADVAQFLDKKLPPSVTPNGLQADLLYRSNGTFEGTIKVLQGPNAGSTSRDHGTWTMDDSGKFCIKENLVDWNRVVNKCMTAYVSGKEIWVTNEGAGPGDPAVKFATMEK